MTLGDLIAIILIFTLVFYATYLFMPGADGKIKFSAMLISAVNKPEPLKDNKHYNVYEYLKRFGN